MFSPTELMVFRGGRRWYWVSCNHGRVPKCKELEVVGGLMLGLDLGLPLLDVSSTPSYMRRAHCS